MSVLIFETSTSAAKAMVYDLQKGVTNIITRAYPHSVSDGSTLDAERMAALIMEIGNQASAGADIDMISLNSTWHSLLILDENRQPKSRIMTWAYQNAAAHARAVRQDEALTRALYEETGCMPHSIYPLYKIMQLREQGLIDPTDKIADQGSYLYHILTGEWMESISLISGSSLLNIHTLDWNERSLAMAGISASQLPELKRYDQADAQAALTPQAAKKLGIKAGIPVGLPYPDGAMNQVGAGALNPGIMTLSVGTSGALRVTSPTPVLPKDPGTWCYYAPDRYICGAATNGATNCVDWFRTTIAPDMTYKDMDRMALQAVPENIPTFLPFLFGERNPGWNDTRQGGFAGMTGRCRLPDLYTAMLEGILFNLYQCYEMLCTATAEPARILISGGISHSALWLQMAANIWNRSIHVTNLGQASLLGGAAMGLAALHLIDQPSNFPGDPGYLCEPIPEQSTMIRFRYERYLQEYMSYAK